MTRVNFESADHVTKSLDVDGGEMSISFPRVISFSRSATQNIMAFLEAVKAGESPPPLNKWEAELLEKTLPRLYELVKLREEYIRRRPSLAALSEFLHGVLRITEQLKLPDELTLYQHDAYDNAPPTTQHNQVDVSKYL